jgi:hypothetical protein
VSGDHGAVPLTAESFAQVIPREYFAQVNFQRCPEAGCDAPTMTVCALGSWDVKTSYVFHISEDELSAVEIGAGRMVAGLDHPRTDQNTITSGDRAHDRRHPACFPAVTLGQATRMKGPEQQ